MGNLLPFPTSLKESDVMDKTHIPNKVLEKTCSAGLNAVQLSIILVACRFTFGNLQNETLTTEIISQVTGFDIRFINREIKNLIKGKVILTNNKVNDKTEDWIMSDTAKEKYDTIFNHWNQQGITPHRKLTADTTKVIDKVLKVYALEEVLDAISRYSKIYHDKNYFFKYNWTLINFLKQQNALPEFMEDGQKWIAYKTAITQTESPKPKVDLNAYDIKRSWE